MKIKLFLLSLAISIHAWAISITTIASATTIAANTGNFIRWAKHPKRETKKAVRAIKDAAKGKK